MNNKKVLLPKKPSQSLFPWLWIGTWSMGGEGFGPHDERDSLNVLRAAVKNNIRHFDTAGFYAHGRSEFLLSKIIRSKREEFFISSKGGLVWERRRMLHRASPEELREQLYRSLDRLNTNYLDLYQLHWPDPEIPIHRSIYALKKLKQDGLIRYWGVGNLTEEQIREDLDSELNIPHQVHFNPVHQANEILSHGKNRCIHCITSPLEQGLLASGKSSRGRAGIGKKDVRNRNPYFSDPQVMQWNTRLDELVKEHHLSKVSLILMWICCQPHVHAIIPGPRKIKQLNQILRFLSDIKKGDLLASDGKNSILVRDKVRDVIPQDIWQFLSRGPFGQKSGSCFTIYNAWSLITGKS
ncbi:MAG: aldo/keto reductase [Nitrospiraceae bacterium]|nr:MAG: aldo/keto reductase [Nitrospiraceae bacterium]